MKKSLLLKSPLLFILLNFFWGSFVSAQAPTIGFAQRITGLTQPLDIVNAGDGSNRLFVVEKAGTIRVFSSTYANLGLYLTVTGVQSSGSEEGLLSMAFHPNFEVNGFFWVFYVNTSGNLEIARYHADPLLNVAESGSKQVILTINHIGQSNHNGGKLLFGSDGFLYLSVGDGGGAGDPDNSAQMGNTLLGKMIRIDVGLGLTANYTSPASNPYTILNDPGGTIMDEIFSFGLRNPFRWSFDADGNMWIGDVGQNAWEEVSRVTNASGVNFGWRCYEGLVPYPPAGCTPAGTTFPIYVYPNASPSAVTGGFVYRGAFAELQDWYFAADVYSGDIHIINANTLAAAPPQTNVLDLITAFGESESGELFVVSLDGSGYQLLPASALPVVLGEFKGILNNKTAQLEWKTLSEQNVRQFDIEHGSDGSNFSRIGTINATNNPTGSLYHFDHLLTGTERNAFYRLKMVDIDGSFTYSSIVRLLVKGRENSFVHPSVVTNGVINIFITPGYEKVQVMNAQGAIVRAMRVDGRTGNVQMYVGSFAKGVYVVQLIGKDGVVSQKVMVQ